LALTPDNTHVFGRCFTEYRSIGEIVHSIKTPSDFADINDMKTACANKGRLFAGFTLVELLVVILIVSILTAAVIPIIRGRVDSAKWAEANAAAGMIRNAVKVYYAENGVAITGDLNQISVLNALAVGAGDLTGTYFVASDYSIDSVNSEGIATITVTGSLPTAPSGSKTLLPDGSWE
jgi:type IV pilus assembly protein PilA